jgi:hypothetical protein
MRPNHERCLLFILLHRTLLELSPSASEFGTLDFVAVRTTTQKTAAD